MPATILQQGTMTVFTSGATSTTFTFSGLTPGSVLVVLCAIDNTATTPEIAVTDSNSGSWSRVNAGPSTSAPYNQSGQSYVFSRTNSATGSLTITVTDTSGSMGPAEVAQAYEVGGVTGTVEATVSSSSIAASPRAPDAAITTVSANAAIFSCCIFSSTTPVVDSGFTSWGSSVTLGGFSHTIGEYNLAAGIAGAKSLTYGVAAAQRWNVAGIALTTSGGAPTSINTLMLLGTGT